MAFGLSEIVLRIFTPPWLAQRMHALNLTRSAQEFGNDSGWSVESVNGKFVRFTPRTQFPVDYYEFKNTANIDDSGGRVVASDRQPRRRRSAVVPFMGDSFTFGIGVEDRQTYVSLLSQKTSIPFLNLGVPGSALPNDLDIIEFRHKELGSPQLYVFNFFTGNDYTDIIRYYTRGATVKRNRTAELLERSVFSNRLLGKSYLLQLMKSQFFVVPQATMAPGRFGSWFQLDGRWKPMESSIYLIMNGNELYIDEAKRYTTLAVDRLVRLSQQLHFKSVFIIVPDKHQADPEFFERQAGYYGLKKEDLNIWRPNEVIEDQLKANGIPYFDLLPCLNGKTGRYYNVDDHFRPIGHREATKCLMRDFLPYLEELASKGR